MRHMALFAAIVWLAGCGKHEATHTGGTQNSVVSGMLATYKQLVPHGFDADKTCDGLLFNTLTAAARGEVFDVAQARDDVGKWYRTPDHSACTATSREMHYGLWWYAWAVPDLDLVERDWDYAASHVWVMDGRDPGISTLLPDDSTTLAVEGAKLGGPEHEAAKLPVTCLSTLPGFEAHVQMLKIGLRALLQAGNTQDDHCAAAYAAREPHNAFYAAVHGLYTGDQGPAEALLSAGTVCPLDRLPTSADRCEPWLWQRDESSIKDWSPCQAEGKTHSGGDCMLAAAIALGELK